MLRQLLFQQAINSWDLKRRGMTDTGEKDIEDHLQEIVAMQDEDSESRDNTGEDTGSGSTWENTNSSHRSSSSRDSRTITVDYRTYGKQWVKEALAIYFALGVFAYFVVLDAGPAGGLLTFILGLGATYWIALRLFKYIDKFTDKKMRKVERS